jgi:GAF domain-containing protein
MMRREGDDDRLARIVRLAVQQTRAEVGALLLVHEDRGDLQVAAAVGEPLAALTGQFVARTSVAGFAIDDGQPVAVADAGGPGAADEVDQRSGLRTRNLLAVPVVVHGRAAGALELRNAPSSQGFGPEELALAGELAYLAGAAVEEFRGDRFLFALFAAALPHALDPRRGAEAEGLTGELERWLAELRQSPAWRREIGLVTQVRELCAGGDDGAQLAAEVLRALVDSARRRRTWRGGE